MSNVIIEHNVTIPIRSNIPPLPLAEMRVGDHFTLIIKTAAERAAVRQRLSRFQAKNPPAKFGIKKTGRNEIRVHRLSIKTATPAAVVIHRAGEA